jgi:hypothetical protein
MVEHAASSDSQTMNMGLALVQRSHTVLLVALVGVQILIVIVLLGPLATQSDVEQETRFLVSEWRLRDSIMLVLLLGTLAMLWQQSRSRLRVDAEGVSARIARWLGMTLFQQTAGDWQFRWDQVRKVRLQRPKRRLPLGQGLRFYRLVVETANKEIYINPYIWLDSTVADHRAGLHELFGKPEKLQQLVERSPLMEAFLSRGIEVDAQWCSHRARSAGL